MQWDKFMKQIEKETNKSMGYVLYCNVANINPILGCNEFHYPVCIDENDSLNILNDFSSKHFKCINKSILLHYNVKDTP